MNAIKAPSSNSRLYELQSARNRGLRYIYIAFLFSVFVNALMLTGPLFMLQVYDRVLASRSEETLVTLFMLVALLYGLMAFLDYARGRIVARFGARLQASLDERIYNATLRQAVSPKERSSPATAHRDMDSIQSLFSSPVLLAVMDMPWTPFFIGAIFVLHPFLGWLAVAGGSALVFLALLNQFFTHRRVAIAQRSSAEAHVFSEQTRQAAEIVRAQGMHEDATKRWMAQRMKALKQSISASDWTGSFTSLIKALRLFLQSAMLALGAYLVLQNQLTAGAMIAGSILLGRALAPIEQSIGQWQLIEKARSGWRSLGAFLDSVPPEESRVELPQPSSTLALHSVTVIPPGATVPSLRNVSFDVKPGEALGVIGKSGSGKSTLAKVLLGLWQPISGDIRLGGATLNQYEPSALGKHIGYLPQQVSLFSGTVAENIARLALQPDSSAVIQAAKQANAHEMILGLPDGYDTTIQGGESQLSGGQKQRIGLARALYGNPAVLVLDEPNSALDVDGTNALNAAVRDLKMNGRSVLIMTHRPTAISECDKLLVLERGLVKKIGQREEVLRAMVKNADEVTRSLGQVS